jgi:hypothetical protein
MSFDPSRIRAFRHLGYEVDEASGQVTCRYALDDEVEFAERITIEGDLDWTTPAAREAARLVALLAGVSYYKAAAPPVIDLGDLPIREGERELLRVFHLEGLGEYAYRNGLDLSGLEVVGGSQAGDPAPYDAPGPSPLIPFGGGLDSIVTVERLRERAPDAALFVMSRRGVRFEAIEDAAAVTGLPVLRADQELDPQILRSEELGFRNGHVPVTGVLSAVALLVAVLHGRDAVVMSNEWSASIGNAEHDGRTVNHQWSKSEDFELRLRAALDAAFTRPPAYFSYLRARSELWIAREFAGHRRYHDTFRSCNKAFRINPATRLDHWCGTCDKCCFIDLILAPFLTPAQLGEIFDGREPLDQPELVEQFRALIGTSADSKPWECVGDVDECRTAAVLAAERPDRRDTELLHHLTAELGDEAATARAAADRLLEPLGEDHAPAALAPPRQLG